MILLPPSETKRGGGDGPPLDLDSLGFSGLAEPRRQTLDALVDMSLTRPDVAARVLKLGVRQLDEVAVNAAVPSSPTLPAIDRYTGVLYDALAAIDLDENARQWLGANVAIHSAPFGLVGALDMIPAYRLGATASLPGLPSLRSVWSGKISAAMITAAPVFILDLRSQAYVKLGPVPDRISSAYVRVVSASGEGNVRALNHFNKHAKGAFLRDLAVAHPALDSLEALATWALAADFDVRECADGSWDLVVS